jgi:cytochrome c biogenesis protein CcmG/thiol:disulfide interchange protein DsbE
MNWRNAIIAALLVVPLLILLAVGFGHDPRAVPSVLTGRAAPDFSLTSLTGEKTRLSDLRGKPVLINFWSTWCEPCKVEHALLKQAVAAYGDRVHFVGVIYEDEPAKVHEYLAARPLGFTQLVDPQSLTAIDYGVAGVPESFFVDRRGLIQHKEAGALTAELIETTLDRLLGEAVDHD